MIRGLQIAAGVVGALAVGICALYLIGGRAAASAGEPILTYVASALVSLLIGAGLAGGLIGLASLLGRKAELPEQLYDALGSLGEAVRELQRRVEQLNERLAQAPPSPAPPAPAPPPAIDESAISGILTAIEEVKQLALLTDDQRAERLTRQLEERKAEAVANAAAFIADGQWGKAEQWLDTIDAPFNANPEVLAARQSIEKGRRHQDQQGFRELKQRVEDLMATSNFDAAAEIASEFAENYPDHAEARALTDRVIRERDLFRDSAVQRTYDEVKHDLERRNWRRALAGASRLIEKFPDHAKTAKIRGQLALIQENAEIEERLEVESRIQELIRGKRFSEAIELGEDLMERFPLSKQAETLEELLPKLRELAVRQEAESLSP